MNVRPLLLGVSTAAVLLAVTANPASGQRREIKNHRVIEAVRKTNPNADAYRSRDITGDGEKETFCNWFVADVAVALGHDRAIPKHDQPRPDRPADRKPLSANQLYDHFAKQAKKTDGAWKRVDSAGAAAAAKKE